MKSYQHESLHKVESKEKNQQAELKLKSESSPLNNETITEVGVGRKQYGNPVMRQGESLVELLERLKRNCGIISAIDEHDVATELASILRAGGFCRPLQKYGSFHCKYEEVVEEALEECRLAQVTGKPLLWWMGLKEEKVEQRIKGRKGKTNSLVSVATTAEINSVRSTRYGTREKVETRRKRMKIC